jgi:hypothetical protein
MPTEQYAMQKPNAGEKRKAPIKSPARLHQDGDPDVRWDEYMRTSPFQTPTPKIPAIAEYFLLVNAIFGAYLAITVSLNEAVQMVERKQEEHVRNNKTTIEYLDKQFLLFNKMDPRKPSNYPEPKNALHMCSQGGFKTKNAPGGDNQIMAANMCIVMMYTYWEARYRKEIADAAGLKDEKELKIDIMGDLGILRNSIIHHAGDMKTDKTCKILTWFKPGEKINIDLEHFEMIKREIETGLSELSRELEKVI